VATGEQVRVFEGHEDRVTSVAFSPDGQYALSGECHVIPMTQFCFPSTLRLWNVATGEQVRVFEGHEEEVTSVAFSPDGQYILSGACGERNHRATGQPCIIGEMWLWDVATGEPVRSFYGHERRVNSVAFSPDGQLALSGSDDGTVRMWNIETEQEWTCANRHVVELTDEQREQYGLPDDLVLCPEENQTQSLYHQVQLSKNWGKT
jgi:WD40 repeat protein